MDVNISKLLGEMRKLGNNPPDLSNMASLYQLAKAAYFLGESHFCAMPLDQLTPITLGQMGEVPKIHKGHLLVCRVDPEDAEDTVCFIVDKNGDSVPIKFHDIFMELNGSGWLQRDNTILIIKEPSMKQPNSSNSSMPMPAAFIHVYVQSPSDVILVHETERELLQQVDALCWYKPEKNTADGLKESGNRMFNRGKYEEALQFYKRSLATKPSSEFAGILHLNIAAVLLQQERFFEAYKEAEIALAVETVNREKALFRLGKAAYGMRDWDCSEQWYKQLRHEFPASKEAIDGLAKLKVRQQEATHGQYDMMALYALSKSGHKNMDAADFVGPIRVADVPGKGKGLIATRNVPRGTLLSATKAYAIHISGKATGNYRNTHVRCTIETVKQLQRNPQTAKQLYALYAGPGMDRGENIPEGVIDCARIELICAENTFLTDDVVTRAEFYSNEFCVEDDDGEALWLLPSFANHSCLVTAVRVMYGDMFFLYAAKDLEEGEEVTVYYVDPTKMYSERERILAQRQIKCDCKLCVLDRSDPEGEKKREAIRKRQEEIRSLVVTDPRRWLGPMEEMVKEMRRTYNGRELQVHLYWMLPALGSLHSELGNVAKDVEYSNEITGILAELRYPAIRTYITLIQFYLSGFKPPKLREAKRAKQKALQEAKLFLGVTDAKMFERVFGQLEGL